VEDVPTTTDPRPAVRTASLKRRSAQVTLVVVAALAAVLWYLNSPAVVRVAEAEVDPNDGITAVVNSCGAELTVDVYEDDSLVVITVLDHRFRLRLSGNDCQDVIHIPLSVPLGNRLLMDGSAAGRQVPVAP